MALQGRARVLALDSLRGLAAVTVLLNHLFIVFPVMRSQAATPGRLWVNILRFTPARIIWSGNAAVMLFFVLSGYVLSIGFYGSDGVNYRPFAVRRFCRIYIPYIVAVICAVIADVIFFRPGLSSRNDVWGTPITVRLLAEHLSLVLSFNNAAFDPVIWSLVQEMRISLLFPLLMAAVNRWKWTTVLAVSVGLSGVGEVMDHVAWLLHRSSDYGTTFCYIGMFVVGALMAKHQSAIRHRWSVLGSWTKAAVLAGSVLAYTYPSWFFSGVHVLHVGVVNNWAETVGAASFIAIATCSALAGRLLSVRPVAFMGRISYSFYLYHFIVLLSLVNVLSAYSPWVAVFASIPSSIVVATVAHRVVEVPATRLGRRLSSSETKAGAAPLPSGA